jgi:acyl-CoA dehydrogenase
MAAFELITFLFVLCVCLSVPAPAWLLLPGCVLSLAALGLYGHVSGWLLASFWLVFILSSILFCIPPCRRYMLTNRLFARARASFSPMGQTEREALLAGDVGFEGELFSGRTNWPAFFKRPEPHLSEEEQRFIDDKVQHFCGMVNDWQLAQAGDLSPQAWQYLKDEGFFGLMIPKAYGGLGFSAYAHSVIIMRLATRSCTAAITAMVPNSLGPAELLLAYGTEAQKDAYLPGLASGTHIPCFALTSTHAGSDAGSMIDEGIVCRGQFEGQEVLGIRLTWDKRYITLAPIATLIGLAFKMRDPDHLLGEQEEIGITVCLLPADHPGVQIGDRHSPMNLSFMNGPISGKDVFVPIDWIIGGVSMAGSGWRMLVECLSAGRGVSLPALSTASAALMTRVTSAYARVRRQFKLPLCQFEAVQEAMAYIFGSTYLLQGARKFVAASVINDNPSVLTAIAKYHMTEVSRRIIEKAMDVHGGRALQAGPNNYLYYPYVSMPIGITVEGANILTRGLIIFGQGSVRCHPYLYQEMELLNSDDNERLKKFDAILVKHIGYTVSTAMRSFLIGLSGGRLFFVRGPRSVRAYLSKIQRLSYALALCSDLALVVLGGALKRKELLSARLGDALSHLLLASSVLKTFEEEGSRANEKNYLDWAVSTSLYQAQEALYQFLDNFPNRFLSMLCKRVIFPWGRSYKAPSDRLSRSLIKPIVENTALRKKLINHCYLNESEDDAVGLVEITFKKALEVAKIERQISRAKQHNKFASHLQGKALLEVAVAKGIITHIQMKQMQAYEDLRDRALAVDVFDSALNPLTEKAQTTASTSADDMSSVSLNSECVEEKGV